MCLCFIISQILLSNYNAEVFMKKYVLLITMLLAAQFAQAKYISYPMQSIPQIYLNTDSTIFAVVYSIVKYNKATTPNPEYLNELTLVNAGNGKIMGIVSMDTLGVIGGTESISLNISKSTIEYNGHFFDYTTNSEINDTKTGYTDLTIAEHYENELELNSIRVVVNDYGEYTHPEIDMGCYALSIKVYSKDNKLLNIIPKDITFDYSINKKIISDNKEKILLRRDGNNFYNDLYNIIQTIDLNNELSKVYIVPSHIYSNVISFDSQTNNLYYLDTNKISFYDIEQQNSTKYCDLESGVTIDNFKNSNSLIMLKKDNKFKVLNLKDKSISSEFDYYSQPLMSSLNSNIFYQYNDCVLYTCNLADNSTTTKTLSNLEALNPSLYEGDISSDGRYVLAFYSVDSKSFITSWSVDEDKAIYTNDANDDFAEGTSYHNFSYVNAPNAISYFYTKYIDSGNPFYTAKYLCFQNMINSYQCKLSSEFPIVNKPDNSKYYFSECGGIVGVEEICPEAISNVKDENSHKSQLLSVYPNPAKSQITLSNIPSGKSTINLINTKGEKVKSITIEEYSVREITLDINYLISGNYIIELVNDSQKYSSKFSVAK